MPDLDTLSISELSKEVLAFVSSGKEQDGLLDTLQRRLDYRNTEVDAISKLNQELHKFEVVEDAETRKRLLNLLEKLQTMLSPSQFHSDWWKPFIHPILLSGIVNLVKTATRITLDLAARNAHGSEQEATFLASFRQDVLVEYLELLKKSLGGAEIAGLSLEGQEAMDPTTRQYEKIIVGIATHYPIEMFDLVALYMTKVSTRLRASYLLGKMVQSEQLQIHQIVNTSCLETLLDILLTDTYAPLISLSLVSLTQLLPRIPVEIIPHLPSVFTILLRALVWHRLVIQQLRRLTKGVKDEEELMAIFAMRSLHRTVDLYFTHVYGLWPSNLFAFLQKHVGWIKNIEASELANSKSELEFYRDPLISVPPIMDLSSQQVEIIRQGLEPLFHNHTLNPLFLTTSPEEEIVINSEKYKTIADPMELVSYCLERRYRTSSMLDQESSELQEQELRRLMDVFRHFGEDKRRSHVSTGSSPPKSPHKRFLNDPIFPDVDIPAKTIAPTLEQVLTDYESLRGGRRMEPAMDPVHRPMDMPISTQIPIEKGDLVRLQFYLLMTELNMELYLRQVHLAWIRRLRRNRIRDQVKELDQEAEEDKLKIAEERCEAMQAELDRMTIRIRELEDSGKGVSTEPLFSSISEPVVSNDVESQVSTLSEQLKEAQSKIFSLETEIAWLKPKANRASEFELSLAQMTKQGLLWESDLEDKKRLEEERDLLLGEKASLTTQIDTLQKEMQNMKVQVVNLGEQLAGVTAKLVQAERMVEQMDVKNKQLTSQDKNRSLMEEQRVKMLQDKYETIRALNLQLETKIMQLSSQITLQSSREHVTVGQGGEMPKGLTKYNF